MLNYTITLFVFAALAAILGFGGLAGAFAGFAKIMALICISLFVASLLYSIANDNKRPPAH
jgi:uncharacterized membrane protein YtjA (UPF0391 family)